MMSLDFLRHGTISVLVAMAIVEKRCMASADMHLLFYSGELLVYFYYDVGFVISCKLSPKE